MKVDKSEKLYRKLISMGYEEGFCEVIARECRTEWLEGRMYGYISHGEHLREEDIVDEMLALMEDRNRIIQKHQMEQSQGRINEIYNFGLDD